MKKKNKNFILDCILFECTVCEFRLTWFPAYVVSQLLQIVIIILVYLSTVVVVVGVFAFFFSVLFFSLQMVIVFRGEWISLFLTPMLAILVVIFSTAKNKRERERERGIRFLLLWFLTLCGFTKMKRFVYQ